MKRDTGFYPAPHPGSPSASCSGYRGRREPISDRALLPPAAGPASSAPSPLLASLPLPTRPLQPPLDFKHLLAFHFNGAAPLSLFPNFSTVWAGLAGGGMHPSLWVGMEVGFRGQLSAAGSNQELVLQPPSEGIGAPQIETPIWDPRRGPRSLLGWGTRRCQPSPHPHHHSCWACKSL